MFGDLSKGMLKEEEETKEIHPYVENDFKGTPEIQETMKRISKKHSVEITHL